MENKFKKTVLRVLIFLLCIEKTQNLKVIKNIIIPDTKQLNDLCKEEVLQQPLQNFTFNFIQEFFSLKLNTEVDKYQKDIETSVQKFRDVISAIDTIKTTKINTYQIIPSCRLAEIKTSKAAPMTMFSKDFVLKISRDKLIMRGFFFIQQMQGNVPKDLKEFDELYSFKPFSCFKVPYVPTMNKVQIQVKKPTDDFQFTDYSYWALQVNELSLLDENNMHQAYEEYVKEDKINQELNIYICDLKKMSLLEFAGYIMTSYDKLTAQSIYQDLLTFDSKYETELKDCVDVPDHFNFFIQYILKINIQEDIKDYRGFLQNYEDFFLHPTKNWKSDEIKKDLENTTFLFWTCTQGGEHKEYIDWIDFDLRLIKIIEGKTNEKIVIENVFENFSIMFLRFKSKMSIRDNIIKLNLWFLKFLIENYNKNIANEVRAEEQEEIFQGYVIFYLLFCELRSQYPLKYPKMFDSQEELKKAFMELLQLYDSDSDQSDLYYRIDKMNVFKYSLMILEILVVEANQIISFVDDNLVNNRKSLNVSFVKNKESKKLIMKKFNFITEEDFVSEEKIKIIIKEGRIEDILIFIIEYEDSTLVKYKHSQKQRTFMMILIKVLDEIEKDEAKKVEANQNFKAIDTIYYKVFVYLNKLLQFYTLMESESLENMYNFLMIYQDQKEQSKIYFEEIKGYTHIKQFNMVLYESAIMVYPHLIPVLVKKKGLQIESIDNKVLWDYKAQVNKDFTQAKNDLKGQHCLRYNPYYENTATVLIKHQECFYYRNNIFQYFLNSVYSYDENIDSAIESFIFSSQFLQFFEKNLFMIKISKIFKPFINQNHFAPGDNVKQIYIDIFRILIQLASKEDFMIENDSIWPVIKKHFQQCMLQQKQTKYTDDIIKFDNYCPYGFRVYNRAYWFVLFAEMRESNDVTEFLKELQNEEYGRVKGRYDEFIWYLIFHKTIDINEEEGVEDQLNAEENIAKQKVHNLCEEDLKINETFTFKHDSNLFCQILLRIEELTRVFKEKPNEMQALEAFKVMKTETKDAQTIFFSWYIIEFLNNILSFSTFNSEFKKLYDGMKTNLQQYHTNLFKDNVTLVQFKNDSEFLKLAVAYAQSKFSHVVHDKYFSFLIRDVQNVVFQSEEEVKKFINLDSTKRQKLINIEHDLAVGILFYCADTYKHYEMIIKNLENKLFFIIESNEKIYSDVMQNFITNYSALLKENAKQQDYKNTVQNLINWIQIQEEDIKKVFIPNMAENQTRKRGKQITSSQFQVNLVQNPLKKTQPQTIQIQDTEFQIKNTDFSGNEQIVDQEIKNNLLKLAMEDVLVKNIENDSTERKMILEKQKEVLDEQQLQLLQEKSTNQQQIDLEANNRAKITVKRYKKITYVNGQQVSNQEISETEALKYLSDSQKTNTKLLI